MCNFSEGAGFYIVIILCVLVIIGYVGLLLVGAQSAVAVNKISTGNTKYNPTIKTNNLNPKIQGEDGWTCSCGKSNLEDSIFCARCGNKKPENVVDADSIGSWVCSCKNVMSNDNLFWSKCGSRKPEKDNMVIQEEIEQEEQQDSGWVCSCGNILNENALFCNKCGSRRPE